LTNSARLYTLIVVKRTTATNGHLSSLFLPLIFVLVLSACAGGPDASEDPEPASLPTAPVEEKTDSPQVQEGTEEQTEEAEEAVTREAEKAGVEGGTYVMDQEEYEETKKDLQLLVSDLNDIISSRDYKKWLTYLTKEYKDYYSNPTVLSDYSNAPVLNKYNISLRSLRDYFNYVVVQSRRNVEVDDIRAISRNKVKAYMYVDGNPVVVYTLEKVDDKWKITKE
jgi:hypothetical protein